MPSFVFFPPGRKVGGGGGGEGGGSRYIEPSQQTEAAGHFFQPGRFTVYKNANSR